MYSFRKTEGWYEGRPVAAGSTPSKLISAKSSVSTNTSITRTGLPSSIKSSRHSGNSVDCPRAASSTKRRINSSENHGRIITAALPFLHSQGQKPTRRRCPLLPQQRACTSKRSTDKVLPKTLSVGELTPFAKQSHLSDLDRVQNVTGPWSRINCMVLQRMPPPYLCTSL